MVQAMPNADELERRPSRTCKLPLAFVVIAALGACATNPPPPLATPETFETVPCEELPRLKYDQEVKLLQLSTNLQRIRSTGSRGSSGGDGLSELGDSLQNLARSMRLNEITDEITAIRVEIAAIDYNLSSRCRRPLVQDAPTGPHDEDASINPE